MTTLATVGLGDLAPATDAGKLFTVMSILTGLGLLVSFLNFMIRASGRAEIVGLRAMPGHRRTSATTA